MKMNNIIISGLLYLQILLFAACIKKDARVSKNDWVLMNYKLAKIDGTRLDETFCYKKCSSLKYSPFKSKIGVGWLVPAWDNGLLGMKVGEYKKIFITPDQGWGRNPPPGILPTDTLILEVWIVEIL